LGIAAALSGVALAWFASASPDGLEWSIARATGSEEFAGDTTAALKNTTTSIQEATAFLPDYAFKQTPAPEGGANNDPEAQWPAVDAGTSTAGLVGAGLTLVIAALIGFGLMLRRQSGPRHKDTGEPA